LFCAKNTGLSFRDLLTTPLNIEIMKLSACVHDLMFIIAYVAIKKLIYEIRARITITQLAIGKLKAGYLVIRDYARVSGLIWSLGNLSDVGYSKSLRKPDD